MFQPDSLVWGISIYWLVCGVSVDEMVWGYFNGLEGLGSFIRLEYFRTFI